MKSRCLPFPLIAWLLVAGTLAAGPDEGLEDLMKVLQEETEIATQSKLNADYVPGILTVIQGEDLENLGLRTVWESLSLVPGIESSTNNFGNPLPLVRGIGYDTLTSHLKLFVDGIPVNTSFIGANPPVLMMPVEQVERIEVVRGPGAALHGEFAFSGVINVITRKEGKRLFTGVGQYHSGRVGGHYSHEDPARQERFSLSMAVWKTDGADVMLKEDAIFRQQRAISRTPGPASEDEDEESAVATYQRKRLKLTLQAARRVSGLYFGVRSRQPDPDGTGTDEAYALADVRQGFDLTRRIKGEAHLTVTASNRTFTEFMAPPGLIQRRPPPLPPLVFPNGQFFSSFHSERRTDGGADFTWKVAPEHELLLRLDEVVVEILETHQDANINAVTGLPLAGTRRLAETESSKVRPGTLRRITSAAVQDQIQVSPHFTATVGFRVDDFSDVGKGITPRVAGVWRLGDPHLVKVQYAQAFRPPALQALNLPSNTAVGAQGNRALRPETIETFEVGYIYRKPRVVARATAYHSNANDFIGPIANRAQGNVSEFQFDGVELELDWNFRKDWRTVSNLTVFRGTDLTGIRGLEGAAERLYNVALFKHFGKDLLLAGRLLGMGERGRSNSDSRKGALEGYDTLDLTLTHQNHARKGLATRVGVKNLFAADVRAPALPNTYLDDLPRPGRTWWAQASRPF